MLFLRKNKYIFRKGNINFNVQKIPSLFFMKFCFSFDIACLF